MWQKPEQNERNKNIGHHQKGKVLKFFFFDCPRDVWVQQQQQQTSTNQPKNSELLLLLMMITY